MALRLKAILPDSALIYPQQFVQDFLLIKLNSWTAYSSFSNKGFMPQLARYYQQLQNTPSTFKCSRNDSELTAQLLLESGAWEWVEEGELGDILEGSALVGATTVEALRRVGQFM